MHIHINLGAIISGICSLFRRKKKDQVGHTMIEGNEVVTNNFEDGQDQQVVAKKVVLTWEDAFNLIEQTGAFEQLNVKDENLEQKICEEMATVLSETEQDQQSAQDAFIRVFHQNGINVNLQMANLFASAYMESYVYNN